MSESNEKMFIVKRPFYKIIVIINGDDIDVEIKLTSKGKKYASARAKGYHHWMRGDDEAIAEIMQARDNYMPALLKSEKYSFDT